MMRLEVQTIYPLVVSLYLFNTSIFVIDLIKSFIQDIFNYTRLRVHSFVAPISAPFQISTVNTNFPIWLGVVPGIVGAAIIVVIFGLPV